MDAKGGPPSQTTASWFRVISARRTSERIAGSGYSVRDSIVQDESGRKSLTAEMGHADFYELKGPGIEITYRRSDGELTTMSDEFDLLADGKFVADTAVQPEIGILATAVVLPSSRAGLRITLTLLLPEVDVEADSKTPTEVTGGAIITHVFKNVVSRSSPVLQSYEVRPLQGTASAG